jgi:hypothetical protein
VSLIDWHYVVITPAAVGFVVGCKCGWQNTTHDSETARRMAHHHVGGAGEVEES